MLALASWLPCRWSDSGGSVRSLALTPTDSDFHGLAGFRAAWPLLVRHRPGAQDNTRPPARRSLQRPWPAEVGGCRAQGTYPTAGRQRIEEWRLAYGRPIIRRDEEDKPIHEDTRPEHLVFANGVGHVESLGNIINRGLIPA